MKLVIFGTGNAGRAIHRKFKSTHEIVAFIDNNPNLNGSTYAEIPIILVDKINEIAFDQIAFSGFWWKDMKQQLIDLGIPEGKLWIIEDDALSFSTVDRTTNTDMTVKELAQLMRDNDIPYYIEGSSLLNLLRGQDLSNSIDVDIILKSSRDLLTVWELIKGNPLISQYQVRKVLYNKDRILTRKDEIKQLVISSDVDITLMEPMIIDIKPIMDIGKYYIMDDDGDYYFYYNKEFVDGEHYFKYKNMELLIPFREDDYLSLTYGPNWRVPVKKWAHSDYENLLTPDELISMMNGSGYDK